MCLSSFNAAEREKILMLLRECLIRVSHTCVSYDLHSNAAESEKILMLLRERSGSLSHSAKLYSAKHSEGGTLRFPSAL